MEAIDIYRENKIHIQRLADQLNTDDKPKRRMILNDHLDYLSRQMNNDYALKGIISYKQASLYMNWLTNYTIKRHKK